MDTIHGPAAPPLRELIQWLTAHIGSRSLILHGRPGCGKGTQGAVLAGKFGGHAISSGDLFRAASLDPAIEAALNAGDVVDSQAFFDVVLPQLGDTKYAGKPLILDAVGRKHGEEAEVLRVMADSGHPVAAVIHINVPEDVVRQRIHDRRSSGAQRADDGPEQHEHRLEEFQANTLPVLKYYSTLGMLIEVDGVGSEDDVTHRILQTLFDHRPLLGQQP